MAAVEKTPEEAAAYLRGRFRFVCDRYANGSRPTWNTEDLEALNVLLRPFDQPTAPP